jgi:inosine/guanosine/xanthosine phosphorylase family protein
LRPTLGFVLGSGFHHVARGLEVEARIPYAALRGFPPPTVAGHAGELVVGRLGGTPTLVLSGRAHYYEGHSLETVTLGIRLLAALGVRTVLLTNAAGAVNPRFRPGDLMMLTDHLNFMGANPLRGGVTPGLERFVDLTETYDVNLRKRLQRAAKAAGIQLRQGVYLAVSGPNYETPAEVRAFRRLGADAVGMSTVPEAIVARQLGLSVAAVSCLTNLAAGVSSSPLSHHEVLAVGRTAAPQAARLLTGFARLHED